ncbi:outer dense fiber protein 3-like [Haliotis rubra]|uniref:outer dense fiber protein 3-like n=1 Tax=Haliotis rubra TaxID=36100 RepID=UPI001EE56E30|nr:outer dense fiber protein 3-like [Haliotis rubra]
MAHNVTKPRGAIAAMYTSPGPAYGLPKLIGQNTHDPRSSHIKQPSYSFGVRHGKFWDDCSPGPCYYPDTKVNRDGMDGTPHYSLYGRQQDAKSFKTPGPGVYNPEQVGPSAKFRHPQYSFGMRQRYRRTDNNPAANSYTLPNMVGKTVQSGKKQAACYSLSGRQTIGGSSEDLARAPGPGTYNTTDPSTFKNKAPLFSMTSRNIMPGDTTKKPGPGAHSPQKVWIHKKKEPDYSFGIRHSQYLTPLIVDVQE